MVKRMAEHNNMKKAVQQIMLGTVTGKHEQTLKVLNRIKASGYDGLELNRYMIHPTPMFVRMLTRIAGMPTGNGGRLNWHELIKVSGLSVISLHTDLGSLEKEMDAIIEEAKSFHTDKIVITGMYGFDYSDEKEIDSLIMRLNKAGKTLKESGLSLLYHNHNAELTCVDSGMRMYDILLRETEPEYVNFEFDSYWFADAGADPCRWMQTLGTRMKLWHVTDRGIRYSKKAMTPILKADSMELGTGNLELEKMKEIAETNGVEAVILESHKNWINKDPMQSIELSSKWLKKNI